MKQILGLQLITLKANEREIICPLMFLMQNLAWIDWSWYLNFIYTLRKKKGLEILD